MYRKKDREQLHLEGFTMQFGGKLRKDNRWVKYAEMLPLEYIEENYAKHFTENTGIEAITARIAFGALFIKEMENKSDTSTVEYIQENPYAQYFLGLKEFTDKPLFDASMMTHFRKRFPAEEINRINEMMFREKRDETSVNESKEASEQSESENTDKGNSNDTGGTPYGGNGNPPTNQTVENQGHLILDATCAPADIRYPNDLSLLNEAREDLETMIEELWEYNGQGHKTRYSRKKARKLYLSITKQKKPRKNATRKVIEKQLEYIKKNLDDLGKLLSRRGLDIMQEKRIERLLTICKLYRQQQQMYDERSHSCEDRIVSLKQPHIRPIVRGKSGKRYEFGQKIEISVVNGYAFIEIQSYDNFNEGVRLIASVERYKKQYGFYPEAVLADKIYRNRDNLKYCKLRGIRISGPRLGRAPKDTEKSRVVKKQEYADNCERNTVESRFGITKRRYGLNLIMSYLPETGLTEAAMQFFCMNMVRKMRSLFLLFFRCYPNSVIERFLLLINSIFWLACVE